MNQNNNNQTEKPFTNAKQNTINLSSSSINSSLDNRSSSKNPLMDRENDTMSSIPSNPTPTNRKTVYIISSIALVLIAAVIVLIFTNKNPASNDINNSNNAQNTNTSTTSNQTNTNNTSTTSTSTTTVKPQEKIDLIDTIIWVEDSELGSENPKSTLKARYNGSIKQIAQVNINEKSFVAIGVATKDVVFYYLKDQDNPENSSLSTYNLKDSQFQTIFAIDTINFFASAIDQDEFIVQYNINENDKEKFIIAYMTVDYKNTLSSYTVEPAGRGLSSVDSYKVVLSPDRSKFYSVNTYTPPVNAEGGSVKIYNLKNSSGAYTISIASTVNDVSLPLWLNNDKLVIYNLAESAPGPHIFTIPDESLLPISGLGSYVLSYSYNPNRNTLLHSLHDDVDPGISIYEYDFSTYTSSDQLTSESAYARYVGNEQMVVLPITEDTELGEDFGSVESFYLQKLDTDTKTSVGNATVRMFATAYDYAGALL